MKISFSTVLLILMVFMACPVLAEESELPDPLFQSDATLDVTITAPLKTLIRKRPTEDYVPGVFEYMEADGTAVKFDIEVRTRGHFRHENCDFPPLRLNFKKSQTDGTLFDKQDKLKLGVHCDDSERYEQIVLREYLAYRIFNTITDMSFRARLLRVTYVDNEQTMDEQVRYAFLIEHKNRLAERYDMKDLKVPRTTVASLQGDWLNLTSVFEFFIGNTDFSPVAGAPDNECCHNYVLFADNAEPIIAIPYDFDQSGFVDAPYASPNPMFNIRTVRQRLYRGRCVNNEHIPASLRAFSEKRNAIYTLIDEQEGLKSRTRKQIIRFIDKFYKLIDDPKDVEKKIVKQCL